MSLRDDWHFEPSGAADAEERSYSRAWAVIVVTYLIGFASGAVFMLCR